MATSPTAPIRWPAEALWEAVVPSLPGFTVEILPEIDSTNSELMRRFKGSPGRPGQAEPLLLVAEQQSAGRGRLGRQWQSERGASLMFSLGLPLQPASWSGLSLAVGVSVAESLEPASTGGHTAAEEDQRAAYTRPRLGLKWPNDLWLTGPLQDRKLGGILVETASWDGVRYVVIGVGINILPLTLPPAAALASPLPSVAPGWLQQLDATLDAPQALLRIVPTLVQTVQAFEQFGFAPFQARFAARDVLAGRSVQLSDGSQGSAHGVSETGALLVHTAGAMTEISSSEVSVRPVSRPAATHAGAPTC